MGILGTCYLYIWYYSSWLYHIVDMDNCRYQKQNGVTLQLFSFLLMDYEIVFFQRRIITIKSLSDDNEVVYVDKKHEVGKDTDYEVSFIMTREIRYV